MICVNLHASIIDTIESYTHDSHDFMMFSWYLYHNRPIIEYLTMDCSTPTGRFIADLIMERYVYDLTDFGVGTYLEQQQAMGKNYQVLKSFLHVGDIAFISLMYYHDFCMETSMDTIQCVLSVFNVHHDAHFQKAYTQWKRGDRNGTGQLFGEGQDRFMFDKSYQDYYGGWLRAIRWRIRGVCLNTIPTRNIPW